MKKQLALISTLIISIAGLIVFGYLSYNSIFTSTCGVENCNAVKEIPSSVFGFFAYLLLLIISILGLRGKNE